MKYVLSLTLIAMGLFIFWPREASAVSQFSRKYGEPCSTCHNIFPRLNYYGERFLRNGYQSPDDPEGDGDTVGMKALGGEGRLTLGKVENWLGARLNVTPLRIQTNSLDIESNDSKETKLTIGNPDWLQFFVAGSIFKNVSIFIENEFSKDAFKFNWFYLGFHNLVGDYVNFQVGNVSPVLFASFPNRLPLFPALKNEALRLKASNGTGEDSVDVTSARPGITYYGEKGPVVWYAGISPGSSGAEKNNFLNYWTGARLEVTEAMESAFEGSSVTLHYAWGTDTKNTDTAQKRNDYWRLFPSLNVRYGENVDIQGGYVYGKDDNVTLAATPVEGKFYGWTLLGAYVKYPWVPGIAWDRTVPIDNFNGAELHKITPSLTYQIRENMRLTFYAGFDVLGEKTGHTEPAHDFLLNFRTMF
ncbi:MAG: hypothetical protein HY538_05125 [Deltaproteobacteria bacterium]|nr:hypothetical protein [Deltaproteobacteria bacterium]